MKVSLSWTSCLKPNSRLMPCHANIKHITIGKVSMVAEPLATGFWLLVKAILPEASSQWLNTKHETRNS